MFNTGLLFKSHGNAQTEYFWLDPFITNSSLHSRKSCGGPTYPSLQLEKIRAYIRLWSYGGIDDLRFGVFSQWFSWRNRTEISDNSIVQRTYQITQEKRAVCYRTQTTIWGIRTHPIVQWHWESFYTSTHELLFQIPKSWGSWKTCQLFDSAIHIESYYQRIGKAKEALWRCQFLVCL
jgi:hypothetical protein